MTVNTHSLKEGDEVVAYVDGRCSRMTVWKILPPGSAGRAHSAGPWIMLRIRPGGYGIGFDTRSFRPSFDVYSLNECNRNNTPYELIDGDEYCLECERDNREGHYDGCPLKGD